MKRNEEKKKVFRLFNFNRDGKGVDRDEVIGPPNLKNFFKSLWRKSGKILSVNLIMLFMLPSLFLLLFYASSMLFEFHPIFSIIYTVTASILGIPMTVNTSEMIGPLYGMYIASGNIADGAFSSGSVALSNMLNIFGTTIELPTFSTLYYIVIALLLVFTLATWGLQNVGATYLTRNMVRGEPVFVISDYFHAIKKNWKQGLLVGAIDAIFITVLITNVCYFISSPNLNFLTDVIFFINIGIFILYLVMRRYIYLMMITFDITLWKMLKNSLIFTTLGLKRNVMAIIGKVLILAINIALIILLLPLNIAVPLILPLVYYLGISAFISAYAYYPVIEKYMITPYKNTEDDENISEESTDEA